MKKFLLIKNLTYAVDHDDYDRLRAMKWHIVNYRAVNEENCTVAMAVLNFYKGCGVRIRYRDFDKKNCQKSNLYFEGPPPLPHPNTLPDTLEARLEWYKQRLELKEQRTKFTTDKRRAKQRQHRDNWLTYAVDPTDMPSPTRKKGAGRL